jgi:CheY-like chemotaxis protein
MKSILIVDDDELLAGCLQNLLGAEGHVVSCCRNGIDALELLKVRSFDIIVTDYHMPRMTGAEFTEQARNRMVDSLIVGYSGHGMKNDFVKAGADFFLLKPFELSELLSLIKRHDD